MRHCWNMEGISVNHLHASIAMLGAWEESDEDEMNDLLLKAAELADLELKVGSSDK